ncbi:hypothetical protein L3X38_042010 [Prunus dulcis]|uniref:Uncharacterized protein n=1 Tax=Prunus dulcis TaxID=3755 RepID=A0AAD4UVG1_PRUDU|nr:hypothetical protein L3X38_042010 [Prunus dulcis]
MSHLRRVLERQEQEEEEIRCRCAEEDREVNEEEEEMVVAVCIPNESRKHHHRRALNVDRHRQPRVENLYNMEYLRKPTARDLRRLVQKAEAQGFPGLIGSIDCMH